MNINVYDDINSMFSREWDNNSRKPSSDNMLRPDYSGDMPMFPKHTPLAMAYVPFQNWGDTMSPEDALDCGTLFSDLVYPFKGGGSK